MDKVSLHYGLSYVLQGYFLQDNLTTLNAWIRVSLPCGFSYVWSENYSDWTSFYTGYKDKGFFSFLICTINLPLSLKLYLPDFMGKVSLSLVWVFRCVTRLLPSRSLTALNTWIRFLSRVGFHMCDQRITLPEPLISLATWIRFLSFVGSYM